VLKLLVSVVDAAEARAALAGGADVIDAKDARRGRLGALRPTALAAIRAAVPAARPLSAVLGDGGDEPGIERAAGTLAARGVAFAKLGFGGLATARAARRLASAARRGAGSNTALVLVAYADWAGAASLAPELVVAVAAEVGAAGVLFDTARKQASLFQVVAPEAVGDWVARVHGAGLFAGLAGGLRGADFAAARALDADLVGVRGAACVGGRRGRVSAARVAALRAAVRAALGPRVATLV
jgi:(5-formylfuran-3-yl)methyl phosphate synthase